MNYSLLSTSMLQDAVIRDLCKEDITTKNNLKKKRDVKTKILYICLAVTFLSIVGSIIIMLASRRFNPVQLLPAILGILLGVTSFILYIRAKNSLINFRSKRIIKSIKLGMLPFGSYVGNQGRYVYDGSGLADTVDVKIPPASAPEKVRQIQKIHKHLTETVPDILPAKYPTQVNLEEHQVDHTLFAEEAKLHTIYNRTFELFDSMKTEVVPTPLLHLSSEQLEELVWVADKCTADTGWTDVPLVGILQDDILKTVQEVVALLEEEVDPEGEASQERGKSSSLLKDFLQQIKNDQQVLATRRKNSLAGVMPNYAKDLQRLSVMTSYNCYCPSCNDKVIKASACENWDSPNGEFPGFDFATRMGPVKGGLLWECPVCGHQTEEPFPVHKLLDELVYPTMDRLLQENRVERLKVYHQAQEKKRQVIDAIQKDIRLLAESTEKEAREFKSRIREIASGVDGAKDTIELLATELSELDALRNSRIAQLSNQMNAHIQKIADYKKNTLSEYRKSVEGIMNEAERDLSKLAAVARQEEQARMAIQQQIAKNISRQTALAEKQVELGQKHVSIANQELEASQKSNSLLAEGNALNRSMVRKMGGFKAKFPNVIGQTSEAIGDIGQALTGASDYDRARSETSK